VKFGEFREAMDRKVETAERALETARLDQSRLALAIEKSTRGELTAPRAGRSAKDAFPRPADEL
jgi:hypothetical protein